MPPAVALWLEVGFRVVDYALSEFDSASAGGGRLVMRKSLIADEKPFDLAEHRERVSAGLAVRCGVDGIDGLGRLDEIALEIPEEVADFTAQQSVEARLVNAALRRHVNEVIEVDLTNIVKHGGGSTMHDVPGRETPARRPQVSTTA